MSSMLVVESVRRHVRAEALRHLVHVYGDVERRLAVVVPQA